MSIVNASLTPGDELENLRLGTRKQYTSPWTLIKAGDSAYFQHGLGEIPAMVRVCQSEDSGGLLQCPALDIEIEYTDRGETEGVATQGSESTHVRITNFSGDGPSGTGLYFQVMAM